MTNYSQIIFVSSKITTLQFFLIAIKLALQKVFVPHKKQKKSIIKNWVECTCIKKWVVKVEIYSFLIAILATKMLPLTYKIRAGSIQFEA
jgi:hypothetical protein